VYQSNGVTVTAFLVDHGAVRPAFGYRIDYAGRSVAISGDTRPSDNLVKFAKGVDVLVHEVFNTRQGGPGGKDGKDGKGGNGPAAYHTTPEQAADIFKRVAPRLAVYSHLAPMAFDPTDRTRAAGYTGPLLVGSDLTVITIGDKISSKPATLRPPGGPPGGPPGRK
jgi:ribonuclease Z